MMRVGRLGLAVFAALSFSCAGDNSLEPCDVRKTQCQEDVFLAVSDVRGSSWDPWFPLPEMRVITKAQYRAELISQAANAPATPGGLNQPDDLTRALKLLHLLDPDEPPDSAIEHDVTYVAAYYDPALQRVTIVDRGADTDWCDDVRTLAHELVHACQDRDLYFKTLTRDVDSFDDQQVFDALIEGEAVLYSMLVDRKQHEHPRCRSAEHQALEVPDWLEAARGTVAAPTPPRSPFRTATSLLGYPLGARYLGDAYASGGSLGVRRVFEPRPDGDVRLMNEHGSEWDRPLPAWSCAAADPPEGYAASIAADWGGFVAYAFATLVLTPETAAWDNALASAGDHFVVYSNAAHEVIVDWALRFRSPEAAQALAQALAQSGLAGSIQSQLQGDVLQLRANSQPLSAADMPWTSCAQ